jgi:hypothetical protein
VPNHEGGEQAPPADLRQADDLLSLFGAHAGGVREILSLSIPEDVGSFQRVHWLPDLFDNQAARNTLEAASPLLR